MKTEKTNRQNLLSINDDVDVEEKKNLFVNFFAIFVNSALVNNNNDDELSDLNERLNEEIFDHQVKVEDTSSFEDALHQKSDDEFSMKFIKNSKRFIIVDEDSSVVVTTTSLSVRAKFTFVKDESIVTIIFIKDPAIDKFKLKSLVNALLKRKSSISSSKSLKKIYSVDFDSDDDQQKKKSKTTMSMSEFFLETTRLQIAQSKQKLRQRNSQVKAKAEERRFVTATKQRQRNQTHELLLKHHKQQNLQLQIQLIIIQQAANKSKIVKRRRLVKTLSKDDEIIADEL